MIILTKEQADKIAGLLGEYASALNNMYCHYDHYSKEDLDNKTRGIWELETALESQDKEWIADKLRGDR